MLLQDMTEVIFQRGPEDSAQGLSLSSITRNNLVKWLAVRSSNFEGLNAGRSDEEEDTRYTDSLICSKQGVGECSLRILSP